MEFPVFEFLPIASCPAPLKRAWLCCVCALPSGIYTYWYDPYMPRQAILASHHRKDASVPSSSSWLFTGLTPVCPCLYWGKSNAHYFFLIYQAKCRRHGGCDAPEQASVNIRQSIYLSVTQIFLQKIEPWRVDFEQARLLWENKLGPQTAAAVINNMKLMDRQDQVLSETVLYSP